jgi:serine/threonine protein kinase
MATAMTSSGFLKVIRDNKLVDEGQLQQCLQAVSKAVKEGADALPIADALVENRLLTRFQANLLTQGKSRSLRITSKYLLLDRLGSGGMGLVYLCEHIRMKRLVALKVLPSAQAKEPGTLERFQREAQAVASLKHPNIVQAFDIDSDHSMHYLVMEYIDGLNLEKLVSKHGPVEPARAAHYIAQAANGLQHAADRGLVHRDVKPSNLLIDREGCIKVLDMGLARFFDSRSDNITERFDSNSVIGTADFISPEQALNSHEVDIRADVYSLGCTFYYLVTGKAPYHEANLTQKLLMHQMREPAPVEQLALGLDVRLAEIIRKMMAKKATDRFQAPGEVAAALAPWAEMPIPRPTEFPPNQAVVASDVAETANTMVRVTQANLSPPTQKKSALPSHIRAPAAQSAVQAAEPLPAKKKPKRIGKQKLWIAGGVGALGIMLAALFIARPWASIEPRPVADAGGNDPAAKRVPAEPDRVQGPAAKARPDKQPATAKLPWNASAAADDAGFVPIKQGPASVDLRTQPTDALIVTEAELAKPAIRSALLRQAIEADGDVASLIPFAVVNRGSGAPIGFVTLLGQGNARAIAPGTTGAGVVKSFAGATPEAIVGLESDAEFPKGTTTVNALIAPFVNVSAPEGGATLKLRGGAILFTSKTFTKATEVGAGKNPLTFDFDGKAGYLYVCCEQDFTNMPFLGKFQLRAQLTNFGDHPLIISGLGGNTLRLDNAANTNPMLVVQGSPIINKGKRFRVLFTADSALGAPGGPILINDAGLMLANGNDVVVDRPLTVQKVAQTAALLRQAKLHWAGKVDGTGKLQILSTGQVTLSRSDNSYSGGTEVQGATLVLKGESNGQYGTPAGAGPIEVAPVGVLTGTGQIMKRLTVKGGVLRPGNDEGKSLICNDALELNVQAMPKGDRVPQLSFRLNGPKARPLVCASRVFALDLNDSLLEVSFVGNYSPAKTDRCVLVENQSGRPIIGNFQGAPQEGTVKTADGRWMAKITYAGQAVSGSIRGGHDVMLYDFALVNP